MSKTENYPPVTQADINRPCVVLWTSFAQLQQDIASCGDGCTGLRLLGDYQGQMVEVTLQVNKPTTDEIAARYAAVSSVSIAPANPWVAELREAIAKAPSMPILPMPPEPDVAAERESCAQVLDAMASEAEGNMEPSSVVAYYREKAAAIRARGQMGSMSPPQPEPGARDLLVANLLIAIARQFIDDNRVTCPEATTSDRVYENAPELVEKLAEVVGYFGTEDEA